MKRIITRGQAPIQVNGDNIISHMVRFVKTFFNFLIPKVKKAKLLGLSGRKCLGLLCKLTVNYRQNEIYFCFC